MSWADLFAALALVLVIEGLFPFANPTAWRRMVHSIGTMDDRVLRIAGAASIGVGLLLLYIVR